MCDVIISIVTCLEILDDLFVVNQKLFSIMEMIFILHWYFRYQLPHIIDYDIFIILMEVGVERTIHKF